VLTNIGEDEHLKQYGGQAAYIESTTEILRHVKGKPGEPGLIVLNRDDRYFDVAVAKCAADAKLLTFSIHDPRADVRAVDIEYALDHIQFTCVTPTDRFTVNCHASGEFGVYNVLASVTAAWGMGIPVATIQQGLENFTKVSARFQVLTNKGPTVIVDYGHTVPGLKRVFEELKRYQKQASLTGRIIAVYGCHEAWEANKRRKMVKLLLAQADDVIFSTNGWVEMSDKDMLQQALIGNDDENYQIEWDRHKAIAMAVDSATADDIVVVLGRGAQPLMHQKNVKYYLNDVEATKKILKQRGLYQPLHAEENPIIKSFGGALSNRIHRVLAKIRR
jgi:UDP-N-acetylmuramoyl-L-alanyl-D-glutamate--2,6-diaminopimelate ligase